MSEYFSRIQALLDNIRQELESIIRRVTWAFLHIIDDGRVPFKDWEDLELEEKNIHVSIQDVHFFHLQKGFSEQPASEIFLR